MALGDNTPFFNETTFGLGDEQTFTSGVSGIKVSDGSAAKVLFTYNNLGSLDSVTTTTSAVMFVFDANGVPQNQIVYEMDIDTAYDGEVISVINSAREATQFTFNKDASLSGGSGFQTLSAQGNNSVGPTLRRLYTLGYV
jgi:hypothetical protein